MKKGKSFLILLISVLVIVFTCVITLADLGFNQAVYAGDIKLGLDLDGGVSITYQAVEGSDPTSEQMNGALAVIRRRLDSHGYTEANAYLDGTDRIRVEIPGVSDASAAVEEIGRTAMLRFVGIDLASVTSDTDIMNAYVEEYTANANASAEDGTTYTSDDLYSEALTYLQDDPVSCLTEYPSIIESAVSAGYAEEIVDGTHVASATFQEGQISSTSGIEPYVKLEFDSEGTELFAAGTEKYTGKYIAIMLDETVCSIPTVSETISDGVAIITGMSSADEAKTLAADITGGALPVELEDIEHKSVGATLGRNALQTSILAGIIGFAIIVVFMIVVYRVPGACASLALAFYVALELLIFHLLGWTLTLPGIAGFLLSIGMAVDANIVIFSRIREELSSGKTIRLSVKSGFRKALSAILDGNITTLIAAVVLYIFGSGTIKGFAQTLGLGILLSMFSALVVTRLLLVSLENLLPARTVLYASKVSDRAKERMSRFKVVGKRKIWFLIAAVVLVCGLISLIFRGFNLDIDFAGGTILEVNLHTEDYDMTELSDLVSSVTGDENPQIVEVTGADSSGQVQIKIQEITTEQITELYNALADKYGLDKEGKTDLIEQSTISPVVSSEMRHDAIVSSVIAAVLMLIYISIRFRDIAFGMASLIPLIHDCLVVVAFYTLLQIPLSSTFIVTLLTILGYSINNTIVVFDRVRENRPLYRRGQLDKLVDESIVQTLGRSLGSSFTTIIMVLMLYILGVESLRWFALPILIGLVAGTYSSLFIAGPMWYLLENKLHK